MKFEINFEHMPEYVLIQTEGEASAIGFDELLTTLVNSPKWVTGTDQIVDHRKLLMENLTSDKMKIIRGIVIMHSKQLGGGRCAFVIKGKFEFGMARMYELVGGDKIHIKVGVFRSINEAVEWLKQ